MQSRNLNQTVKRIIDGVSSIAIGTTLREEFVDIEPYFYGGKIH